MIEAIEVVTQPSAVAAVDVLEEESDVVIVEVVGVGIAGPPGEPGPAGGVPEAPIDGKQYARQDADWAEVIAGDGGSGPVAWDDITGKPSTFPPELPIAQAGVTNLLTDLAAKAPLASPGLTGAPTAPTAPLGTNTTQIASTAFVGAAVAANVEDWNDLTGKPATFPPTLPIAQADVTNLVTDLAGKAAAVHTHAQADITNLAADLALKAPLAGPTFTGVPAAPTAATATNTTQLATTAFVQSVGATLTPRYSHSTATGTPSAGSVRVGTSTPSAIVNLNIHYTDSDGLDRKDRILAMVKTGATIMLQDYSPQTDWVVLQITGNPTDNTTWCAVACTYVAGSAAVPSGNGLLVFLHPPVLGDRWTQMTQAAYDALTPKDANMLYVIVG